MRDLFEPPDGFVPDPRPLILASSSPRRRELMQRYGYVHQVIEPDPLAECGICTRETPPEMVARLAYQKAADVIGKIEDGFVLACDTVAECVGLVLGKPKDRDHAQAMLSRLSGREHRVYSGVCLWDRASAARYVQVAKSTLRMKAIDASTIEEYLDTDQWIGKAGALGFQDGPPWVELVEGSATNVVGLPMELLSEMLAAFMPNSQRD